jgi:3-methylcrotonyl-CoA carboxylase alpha subunit
MFETILIANRGEIACRVIRTCKKLGIRTVAVFSEADRGSLFVNMADVAVEIGGPAPRDSYLRAERILEAAKRTGADAIHPGYGFLSENAAFAEACAKASIRFIGPPASAIVAMGLKDAAKALMEKAGVPVVPGYHGADQSLDTLTRAAERIGFPVLIKAVAGGGGKGMRRVNARAELESGLLAAQREAENAFGDSRVLIEKYLEKPRHIEVQVFADSHGQAVHLFERDCSIQRRHQKVIEEAPAPDMPEAMRKAMGEAAVRAAKAIHYEGAGTVEFIADVSKGLSIDSFFFMEMNTRLQVEHPVTELITGLDLVEWQIRVAQGERLPLTQDAIVLNGHAVEARIYAEDPTRDYLPQTGKLMRLRMPEQTAHVRVDTGVVEGDTVSVFYDPMIAKLVVWDQDRARALRRMRRALEEVEVSGLTTNLALLHAVAAHEAFKKGDVHTGFLGQHEATLFARDAARDRTLLALGCAGLLLQRAQAAKVEHSQDRWSPWARTDAFRLNEPSADVLFLKRGEEELSIPVTFASPGADAAELTISGEKLAYAQAQLRGDTVSAQIDGARASATYVTHGERTSVICDGLTLELAIVRALHESDDDGPGGGIIKAPMPGKIIAVLVEKGQAVEKGQPLVRLEAMKMEHTLSAALSGTVRELSVRVGDQVEEGSTLLVLEAHEEK